MKLKIAIVGCGMIADAHVSEIKKIEEAEVIAVCDKELLMAAQLADRFDIPSRFSDFDQMLAKCQPDVVHILTPPSSHFALGISALEAGCHVLIEKPFTVTLDEAQDLINKAMELNKKIIVNHFHNFSPASQRLKEMVSRGELGEVIHLEGFYSYNLKSTVTDALIKNRHSWIHKLPGNVIHNNIDHLIGKFTEFIPDSQPEVWARAKQISENVKQVHQSRIYDELRVVISGKNVSAYATISSNINPFQHKMEIYGTKRTVTIDYESRSLVSVPTSSLPGPFGKLAIPFKIGRRYRKEGFKNLINFAKSDYHFYAGSNTLFNQFYQSIINDTNVPIPYSDIIKNTWIREEVLKQIDTKLYSFL